MKKNSKTHFCLKNAYKARKIANTLCFCKKMHAKGRRSKINIEFLDLKRNKARKIANIFSFRLQKDAKPYSVLQEKCIQSKKNNNNIVFSEENACKGRTIANSLCSCREIHAEGKKKSKICRFWPNSFKAQGQK